MQPKKVPESCKSVGDILTWFIREYDLNNWEPGVMVRSAIISGLNAALKNFKRNA